MRHNPPRSAVSIAKLLGTEGYSDFVHNQVERYWRQIVLHGNGGNVDRVDAQFSDIMATLSPEDKKIIGEFITYKSKMNFDTGLRLGVQATLHDAEMLRKSKETEDNAARYKYLRETAPHTVCQIAYRVRAACDFETPDEAVDAARAQPRRK